MPSLATKIQRSKSSYNLQPQKPKAVKVTADDQPTFLQLAEKKIKHIVQGQ